MEATLVKVSIIIALGAMILTEAQQAQAVEVKPFVSASYIRAADSDIYKWDDNGQGGYHVQNTENLATLKAGVVIREGGLSLDINLFHESDPTNGALGKLNEGDKGVNGFEITARKEW